MKKKQKQSAKKAFRVPPWVLAVGALVIMAVVPWLLMETDSSAPKGPSRSLPTAPVWTPLVSKQYGFSVSLPAPPQSLSSSGGFGLDAKWSAQYQGGTFMVQATGCPEKLCTEAPDSMLTGSKEGALAMLGGKLLSEKPLQVPCPQGTCSGLEFAATSSQGLSYSARIIITRDKVFQLMGTEYSGSDEVFRKMVDSFTFLP